MKIIIIFLLLPVICKSQGNNITIYRDTFNITMSDIHSQMAKYNRSHEGDFWKLNIIKDPIYQNNDTIIYNTKFLTNYDGMLLWGAKCRFFKANDKIACEVYELTQLKRSSFGHGVTFINVKVDEMEKTKGNEFNLVRIKKEIQHFFKYFR